MESRFRGFEFRIKGLGCRVHVPDLGLDSLDPNFFSRLTKGLVAEAHFGSVVRLHLMCLGSFQEVSRKSAQIYETSSLVGSGGSLNATPHSGYNSGSTMWEACACRILSHTDACRGPSLRNVELLVPKSICANFKREGLNSSTWKLWALAPSTSALAPNATTFRV